ncbi:cobyric acid synthase [Marinicrinis sediminis]|uniref:Cobyric acid synthase n=1 Tax=Marinicrinis sediminis TaxID=1652465 RepID=A0ABW5R6B1_9BACL
MKLEKYGHGGDWHSAEEAFGQPEHGWLDFSANMNPFGPPDSVQHTIREEWEALTRYPDPAVRRLRTKLAQQHRIPAESILIGNGAAELIDLIVRVLSPQETVIASPSFSEYEEAIHKIKGNIRRIPLREDQSFELDNSEWLEAASESNWLFLGHPNNPTGRLIPQQVLHALMQRGSGLILDEAFIDFVPRADQVSMLEQAAYSEKLVVIRSMTKFYAIPGIRLGFLVAHPHLIRQLRKLQTSWSVNHLAQCIGATVLDEFEYATRTWDWLQHERPWLQTQLSQLGLKVFPSDVNFLLIKLPAGYAVKDVQEELGKQGILIRDASLFVGLDGSFFRIAIRHRADNAKLLAALDAYLNTSSSGKRAQATAAQEQICQPHKKVSQSHKKTSQSYKPNYQAYKEAVHTNEAISQGLLKGNEALRAGSCAKPQQSGISDEQGEQSREELVPLTVSADSAAQSLPTEQAAAGQSASNQGATIMLQGTASDVGKSLLTAAFCRIFKQDGLRPAPFKSQNMSLNSAITIDGKEIGRAQAMQADACGIPATTDMNPILLKPKKDMTAQVVIHGKPYADMTASDYRTHYLPYAEKTVKTSLQRLREAHDVVVIEGAGSPAEVNLKARDIVNMRLAAWADAPVWLVADIDRGGVFASVVGTLDILEPAERDRVCGVIINKFRGDVALLEPGITWLEDRIGKPVLGVIPFIEGLALEDEDGASLDRKLRNKETVSISHEAAQTEPKQLEIAVIRLPRLSNFTDIDPLEMEEDVQIRYVSSVHEWGQPDAVILPGSKNTMDDLQFLTDSGLTSRLIEHVQQGGRLVGICAGYQMMGQTLLDPLGTESDRTEMQGLGLFAMETTFTPDKRTEQIIGKAEFAEGRFPVEGYEIHMGRSRFLEPVRQPFCIRRQAEPDQKEAYHADGAMTENGRVWGTYIHGIFHNDDLRRQWLNMLRQEKGLNVHQHSSSYRQRREASFDRLAEQVRKHVDLKRLYESMHLQ